MLFFFLFLSGKIFKCMRNEILFHELLTQTFAHPISWINTVYLSIYLLASPMAFPFVWFVFGLGPFFALLCLPLSVLMLQSLVSFLSPTVSVCYGFVFILLSLPMSIPSVGFLCFTLIPSSTSCIASCMNLPMPFPSVFLSVCLSVYLSFWRPQSSFYLLSHLG